MPIQTIPEYRVWRGSLSSFGSEADGKHVKKSGFVLQATDDGAVWDTLASDTYRIFKRAGDIEIRVVDDTGAGVDIFAYTDYQELGNQAFRVTYTVTDNGTETTYTTEALTLYEMVEFPGGGIEIEPLAETAEIGIGAITSKRIDTNIQSDNFVTGVSGWKIWRTTGNSEFNNVTVRGTIYATVGEIGGWTIGAASLSGGNATLHSSGYLNLGTSNDIVKLDAADATYRMWIGNAVAASAPFRVAKTGAVTATNATITGSITSTSGAIGGFTIAASTLTATNLILDSANQEVRLGSGNNIVVLDAADATYRMWIGNAVAASAPFRVTQAGAVTASNIDLAGGSVSGTFTVSGTLRNAASPNARYELTSAGLKGYDSGNIQRYQIANDGSGWLGSSSVFSWTAAGVVSLNGSAVVGNSLDAGAVSFTAPTISGLSLTNNSPSAGYVAWSSFKLTYQGVSYTISAGNSNNKYIYWKKSVSTTVLQTSAAIPANAPDMFIVCVNFSGTAYQSNFAPFIYADYISVGNLAAINADMGNITAGTITGGTIRTASSGARTEMHSTNLFGLGFGGIGGINGSAAVQWYAKATDGKLYAGSGDVLIDSDGLSIATGAAAGNNVKFTYSGNTVFSLSADYDPGPPTRIGAVLSANKGTVSVATLDLMAQKSDGTYVSLSIDGSNGRIYTAAPLEVNNTFKFTTDNTYDIGASGANRPRDVYIGGEYRFYSERAIVHGIYDRANSDTTVGNTVVETTLYSKSITANDLGATGGIRVSLYGQWTNNTGANRTLTIRVKFGATTVHTANLTLDSSATNGHFETVILLFNTATNAQRLSHRSDFRRGTTFVDSALNTTLTSAEDTTSDKTFAVTVQWNSASANATLTKKFAFIELMPA